VEEERKKGGEGSLRIIRSSPICLGEERKKKRKEKSQERKEEEKEKRGFAEESFFLLFFLPPLSHLVKHGREKGRRGEEKKKKDPISDLANEEIKKTRGRKKVPIFLSRSPRWGKGGTKGESEKGKKRDVDDDLFFLTSRSMTGKRNLKRGGGKGSEVLFFADPVNEVRKRKMSPSLLIFLTSVVGGAKKEKKKVDLPLLGKTRIPLHEKKGRNR